MSPSLTLVDQEQIRLDNDAKLQAIVGLYAVKTGRPILQDARSEFARLVKPFDFKDIRRACDRVAEKNTFGKLDWSDLTEFLPRVEKGNATYRGHYSCDGDWQGDWSKTPKEELLRVAVYMQCHAPSEDRKETFSKFLHDCGLKDRYEGDRRVSTLDRYEARRKEFYALCEKRGVSISHIEEGAALVPTTGQLSERQIAELFDPFEGDI